MDSSVTQEKTTWKQRCFYASYTLCAGVGLFVLGRVSLRSLGYFIKRKRSLAERYGSNSWALITGATDGIGKTFAQTLAGEKFNLLLVGRNPSLLELSQKEILANHPEIQVATQCYDFSQITETTQYSIFDEISKNYDISLFVSCAGITQFDRFHETGEKLISDLIKVNVTPSVTITRKILPKMLERKSLSGLIFVSSYTCLNEMPFVSVYAGTKGFVDSFARSLAIEYADKLDVLSLTPYYVSTKMTRNMKPSFETVTRDVVVEQALNDLGRKRQSFGSLNHFLIDLLYRISPVRWSDYFKHKKMGKMIATVDQMKRLRRKASKNKVE